MTKVRRSGIGSSGRRSSNQSHWIEINSLMAWQAVNPQLSVPLDFCTASWPFLAITTRWSLLPTGFYHLLVSITRWSRSPTGLYHQLALPPTGYHTPPVCLHPEVCLHSPTCLHGVKTVCVTDRGTRRYTACTECLKTRLVTRLLQSREIHRPKNLVLGLLSWLDLF